MVLIGRNVPCEDLKAFSLGLIEGKSNDTMYGEAKAIFVKLVSARAKAQSCSYIEYLRRWERAPARVSIHAVKSKKVAATAL